MAFSFEYIIFAFLTLFKFFFIFFYSLNIKKIYIYILPKIYTFTLIPPSSIFAFIFMHNVNILRVGCRCLKMFLCCISLYILASHKTNLISKTHHHKKWIFYGLFNKHWWLKLKPQTKLKTIGCHEDSLQCLFFLQSIFSTSMIYFWTFKFKFAIIETWFYTFNILNKHVPIFSSCLLENGNYFTVLLNILS